MNIQPQPYSAAKRQMFADLMRYEDVLREMPLDNLETYFEERELLEPGVGALSQDGVTMVVKYYSRRSLCIKGDLEQVEVVARRQELWSQGDFTDEDGVTLR